MKCTVKYDFRIVSILYIDLIYECISNFFFLKRAIKWKSLVNKDTKKKTSNKYISNLQIEKLNGNYVLIVFFFEMYFQSRGFRTLSVFMNWNFFDIDDFMGQHHSVKMDLNQFNSKIKQKKFDFSFILIFVSFSLKILNNL